MSIFTSGHEVVTSTTKPATPLTGQIIYCTDTDEYLKYTADSLLDTTVGWHKINNAINRNLIINGSFDIWQRGTTAAVTTGSYNSDRFLITFDGTGATRAITRTTTTLGTLSPVGNSKYSLNYNQSVAGSTGTFNTIRQRVESVITGSGQTLTVSYYAKCSSSTVTLPSAGQIVQNFGTTGSPSTAVTTNISGTAPVITTSWKRFSFSVAVPSISGKTLGTDNNDYLELVISLPINSTFNIDLWGVQLEVGSAPSEFEFAPIQQTLAKCQRYYFRFAAGNTYQRLSWGFFSDAVSIIMTISLPVPLRTVAVTPVIDYSGTIYATNYVGANFAVSGIAATSDQSSPVTIAASGTVAGATGGQGAYVRAITTATYLGISAEL